MIKFIKSLTLSAKFADKEILNAIAIQAEKLKVTFGEVDESSQIWVCNALSMKHEFINNEYRPIVIELTEYLIKKLDKSDSFNFRYLETCFQNSSRFYLNDHSLYDSLLTQFEKAFDKLNDHQLVTLLDRSINLTQKLQQNEKYSDTFDSTKLRLRELMLKPQTIQRVINITIIANDPSQQKQLGINNYQQQQVIAKLASLISKQINYMFKQTKADKNNNSNDQLDEEELSDYSIQSEYSLQYEQAWKYIIQYTKQNYKTLDSINFKTLLLALVSSKVGDSELYSLLAEEFHNRVKQQPPEKIHNDFFCICLRCFYTSRIAPINIEKYEQTFSEITKKKLKYMNTANKMTIFISYSTVGDDDMISYILQSGLLTEKEINQLNTKGKIQILWSMCNINVFKESLLENFLLNECIPSNQFYIQNPQQLVQVTQIFHIIKIYQTQFWNKHQQVLNKKLKEFTQLTHHHHAQNIHKNSEYKKKTFGSFDLADVFNSLDIEFYFEPIVEQVFNIDFVLKDISKEKILKIINDKEQITSKYKQISNQFTSKVSKFDASKHSIDKEKDILLEVDGKNHFISLKKKRQSTNCKIDVLERMNYKIIQIDQYELEKMSLIQDKNVLIDKFSKILQEKIKFSVFMKPNKFNDTQNISQDNTKNNKLDE